MLSNYEELSKVFEESSPVWEPGTARGYHMVTMAEIASQLLTRVDGRTIGEYFKEEIAVPFGKNVILASSSCEYTTCNFTVALFSEMCVDRYVFLMGVHNNSISRARRQYIF